MAQHNLRYLISHLLLLHCSGSPVSVMMHTHRVTTETFIQIVAQLEDLLPVVTTPSLQENGRQCLLQLRPFLAKMHQNTRREGANSIIWMLTYGLNETINKLADCLSPSSPADSVERLNDRLCLHTQCLKFLLTYFQQ